MYKTLKVLAKVKSKIIPLSYLLHWNNTRFRLTQQRSEFVSVTYHFPLNNGLSDSERSKGSGYMEYALGLLVWISKDGTVTGDLSIFLVQHKTVCQFSAGIF